MLEWIVALTAGFVISRMNRPRIDVSINKCTTAERNKRTSDNIIHGLMCQSQLTGAEIHQSLYDREQELDGTPKGIVMNDAVCYNDKDMIGVDIRDYYWCNFRYNREKSYINTIYVKRERESGLGLIFDSGRDRGRVVIYEGHHNFKNFTMSVRSRTYEIEEPIIVFILDQNILHGTGNIEVKMRTNQDKKHTTATIIAGIHSYSNTFIVHKTTDEHGHSSVRLGEIAEDSHSKFVMEQFTVGTDDDT